MLIVQASVTASVAVLLLSSAFEGHLYRVGSLPVWTRVLVGAGGLLMLIPEGWTDLIGFGICVAAIVAYSGLRGRRASA